MPNRHRSSRDFSELFHNGKACGCEVGRYHGGMGRGKQEGAISASRRGTSTGEKDITGSSGLSYPLDASTRLNSALSDAISDPPAGSSMPSTAFAANPGTADPPLDQSRSMGQVLTDEQRERLRAIEGSPEVRKAAAALGIDLGRETPISLFDAAAIEHEARHTRSLLDPDPS